MKKQYRCKLLSDVILNVKAASEGPNTTLDFIPGNNFLGIVAAAVYGDEDVSGEMKHELFHSGRVRFGDAHPAADGMRGLKIPACVFYPKLHNIHKEAYIYHAIPNPASREMREKQLKQCREGFYVYHAGTAERVDTQNTFAVKSAYNRNTRTSKDEAMYGYQSLRAGLELLFSVDADDAAALTKVDEVLTGKQVHRIGRSRSAQYGLVEITPASYADAEISQQEDGYVKVYADGRLIFLDEDGMPTFQPSVEALGLSGGEIVWSKSQIRTFCYAPYNYKRKCFDTERCGIEKGSVIVVKTGVKPAAATGYVGHYLGEGFGAVIYNPAFLDADNLGLSKTKYVQGSQETPGQEVPIQDSPNCSGSKLVVYLREQKRVAETEQAIYPMVNDWVRQNTRRFTGSEDNFASQWGEIRSIATVTPDRQVLAEALEKYLTAGVASKKWKEKGRFETFQSFLRLLTEENAQVAIVNLASEMAKVCSKSKK